MDSTAPTRLHSIKLWPPSQSTRQVLVDRIIKNLTTPSILSRKYGLLSKEEAEQEAKQIEVCREGRLLAVQTNTFEKEQVVMMVVLLAEIKGWNQKSYLNQLQHREPTEPVAAEENTFFDISGGKRAFIDADEAKELLKPLQEPGNKYTKICFSNRSFCLAAAHVAAPILSSVKDQFSSALKDAELRYLNLSHNALGEKGVRAFGELLKSQGNLEELYLINDGISEEAAKAVCCSVHTCDSEGDRGRSLMYGIISVVHHNLTEIYLSYLNLENEGTLALVNALKDSTSSLEVLEMAGNDFTAEAAPALAALVLAKKESITKIGLSENELKDEGAGRQVLSQGLSSEIFKNSPDLLGPLDENDPEGEEYDEEEEAEEDGDDNDDELESQLKGLELKQEDGTDQHSLDCGSLHYVLCYDCPRIGGAKSLASTLSALTVRMKAAGALDEQIYKHETVTTSSSKIAEEACEKWRLRGNQAYSNGDLAKAEDYYTKGLNSVSQNEKSRGCLKALMLCCSNRAATRISLGRMKEALGDCLMASNIDPGLQVAAVAASFTLAFLDSLYARMGEIASITGLCSALLMVNSAMRGFCSFFLTEMHDDMKKALEI
ncbi:Ran GTPase-activating protein 1 [Tanacetum coccineum]